MPGRPMTRSMTKRLYEGIAAFIKKTMLEESTTTGEPATRLALKFGGWKLPPGRVDFEAQTHPGRVASLDSPRLSCTTRPGDLYATRPGGTSKA